MMQVMMFAVAMYSGSMNGMDLQVRTYLRIVSMLAATPVMLYAGWPFFSGALRALRERSVSMDVPVSLGLLLAYGASVLDTWRHAGEVYFDSVTMFIFFLTVARYVEMVARHRCNSVADSLSRLLPVTAHRFAPSGGDGLTDVAVAQLVAGDRVLVRAGEVIPADGVILAGSTRVNESMLTGESIAVARAAGEALSAGTVNEEAPVQLRVTAVGAATTLANIVALLGRAQSERPKIMRAADASASRFLVGVLGGALLVGVFWAFVDPARAFPATLAVLVVACPCALSLATLVAVASASAGLARRGVLVARPDAIEALGRASRVVFDKTGTLTSGRVRVTGVQVLGARPEAACLALAAALEGHSEHPIARSFTALCPGAPLAADARVVPGAGIEGHVDGQRYRIGTRAFARGAATPAGETNTAAADDASICLGGRDGLLAAFTLADTLRPDAVAAVQGLRGEGLAVELLSGDADAAAGAVARQCGIDDYAARQTPAGKLRRIMQLREAGEIVAMVGDGINDAPVLGGAGVAIAMGQGSALAQASADLILVGDRLQALPEAVQVARRTRAIIRQNLAWATVYNLAAMPLAALGWVPPWMAAIGMSLSSIGVVLNGMRAK
jgi:Cu2+-exporting ATPase